MRIDLSDPVAGLCMALPLIAILMTASRTPIAFNQRPSQAGERTIRTSQIGRPCQSYGNRRDLGEVVWRWVDGNARNTITRVVAVTWRDRLEAAADCEVVAGCQLTTVERSPLIRR